MANHSQFQSGRKYQKMAEDRIELRKEEFKKGITAEDASDKRHDKASALRKKKREERLAARRGRSFGDAQVAQVVQKSGLQAIEAEHGSMQRMMARINELVQSVMQTEDQAAFSQALEWLRVLSGSKYMIPEVYAAPQFLGQMMKIADIPDAQVADKALTIMTNAALINEAVPVLIKLNVFGLLQRLLATAEVPLVIKSSAAWLLANLVTVDISVRDVAIDCGLHAVIAELIITQEQEHANAPYLPTEAQQFKENATWCTSNFFKGHEPPDYQKLAPSLAVLRMGLFEEEASRQAPINQYAVWATQYASKDLFICRTLLADQAVVDRLSVLCTGPNQSVRLGALRTLGELVTYEEEDEGAQLLENALINAGVANVVTNTLQDQSKLIRHESCFIVANMALTSWRCMAALMSTGVVNVVLRMCDQEVSEVRGEAMRAMCNIAHASIRASTTAEGQELYQRLVQREHLVRRLAAGLSNWNHFVSTEVMRLYLALLRRGSIPSMPRGLTARDIFNMLEESGAYETIENDLTADVTSAYATLTEEVYTICQELANDEEDMDELPMLVETPAAGFNPLASSGSAWGTNQYSF
jgi:hypothetical protein